jgi:hypothetical protein
MAQLDQEIAQQGHAKNEVLTQVERLREELIAHTESVSQRASHWMIGCLPLMKRVCENYYCYFFMFNCLFVYLFDDMNCN